MNIKMLMDFFDHIFYFSNYAVYRKKKGGVWYKHIFTNDAYELGIFSKGTFWARYGWLNRYTKVIDIEEYEQ